jgi:hypothetical protein
MKAEVYVDELFTFDPMLFEKKNPLARQAAGHGKRWCHLWSEDVEALHELAVKIGLKRAWFQNRPDFPHYDLVPSKRVLALSGN